MRVLLVNKFLYPRGGAETYVFQLGKGLQAEGHQVEYFGMKDERNIVGNRLGQTTENLDFHTNSLKRLLYPAKIIYSYQNRVKFARVLEAFRPDIVHLNNINFQLTPAILYEAKSRGIPLVQTAHDYQMICPNHLLYRPPGVVCEECLGGSYMACFRHRCIHNSRAKSLIGWLESTYYHGRKTYSLLDRVICPSQFLADKLLTDPTFEESVMTVHNFVYGPVPPRRVKKDYVLYFGRFSEEKGLNTLLTVCRRFKDIPFLFAGSGPIDIPSGENVKNVGFKTGAELEELIGAARFSVYPSEWYENCPFSVMESIMHHTPVIGAKIGGIPELVQDGKTGLLFPPGDTEILAKQIRRLWDDRSLNDTMTDNCEYHCFTDVKTYCSQMLGVYRQLIRGVAS